MGGAVLVEIMTENTILRDNKINQNFQFFLDKRLKEHNICFMGIKP